MNIKKITINKEKIINSIFVAILLMFTFFLENTLQVYLSNIYEYVFTLLDYFFFFFIMFFISVFIFSLILYFLPNSISYIFFIIAFLVFIQSNFMVWKYGVFDGSIIKWEKYFYYGIIDSIVWILIIVIALLKKEKFKKYINQISIAAVSFGIIFIVLSVFSINVFNLEKKAWFKQYDLINNISFSKNKNVIIWLLDMAQSDIFETLLKEEPIFQEIYKDFTFYPDFSGATPFTRNSISAILTSKNYKHKENRIDFLINAFESESSIIKTLGDNSYDSNISASLNSNEFLYVDPKYVKNTKKRFLKYRANMGSRFLEIFDLSLFRATPHFLKKIIYNNGKFFFRIYLKRSNFFKPKLKKDEKVITEDIIDNKNISSNEISDNKKVENGYDKIKQILNNPINAETRDLALLKSIINSEIIDKNCFNFIILDSPHIPYNFNRDGDYTGNIVENIEKYKDKYVYGLKLTYIFLDYLKNNNIYDNSLIIILGDHGTDTGIDNEKYTIPEKNRANPLLLIKPFYSKNNSNTNIETNYSEISAFDIPSILFKALNIIGENTITENFLNNKEIVKGRERYFYSDAIYSNSNIYEHKIKGNVRDESSWQSTGKLYTIKGEFSFLKTNPIPKNIFKSELLDKLKNDDKQFVLSIYDETKMGYVLKENNKLEDMDRLLHILTMNLNFF